MNTTALQASITQVFPAGFPQLAEVTFDVEWSGILDRAHIHNVAQNFEGQFLQTGSTIQWSSFNPVSGFQFASEGPDPTRVIYAVVGHERNGVFSSSGVREREVRSHRAPLRQRS